MSQVSQSLDAMTIGCNDPAVLLTCPYTVVLATMLLPAQCERHAAEHTLTTWLNTDCNAVLHAPAYTCTSHDNTLPAPPPPNSLSNPQDDPDFNHCSAIRLLTGPAPHMARPSSLDVTCAVPTVQGPPPLMPPAPHFCQRAPPPDITRAPATAKGSVKLLPVRLLPVRLLPAGYYPQALTGPPQAFRRPPAGRLQAARRPPAGRVQAPRGYSTGPAGPFVRPLQAPPQAP
jgi:hypothetical protein